MKTFKRTQESCKSFLKMLVSENERRRLFYVNIYFAHLDAGDIIC